MEVRAIGTTDQKNVDDLLLFIGALAGYTPKPLDIHTIVMKIEGSGRKQLQLINYIIPNSKKTNSWVAIQYASPLLGDLKLATLPATVSTITQSKCHGPDVPGFWSSLGFIQEYQHYKKGWTCDIQRDDFLIHVHIYRLHKIANPDQNASLYPIKNATAELGEQLAPSQVVVEAWTIIDTQASQNTRYAAAAAANKSTGGIDASSAFGIPYRVAIQAISDLGMLLKEKFDIDFQAMHKKI